MIKKHSMILPLRAMLLVFMLCIICIPLTDTSYSMDIIDKILGKKKHDPFGNTIETLYVLAKDNKSYHCKVMLDYYETEDSFSFSGHHRISPSERLDRLMNALEACSWKVPNLDELDKQHLIDYNNELVEEMSIFMSEGFTENDFSKAYLKAMQLLELKNPVLENPVMQFMIGRIYGENGSWHDLEKAISWYNKSAEQGLSIAQYSLGVIYLKTELCNRVSAITMLQKSAEKNDSDAINLLGELFYNNPQLCDGNIFNDNLSQDERFVKSLMLFSKGADLGNVKSIVSLGLIYMKQEGIKNKMDYGLKLLKEAKELGYEFPEE